MDHSAIRAPWPLFTLTRNSHPGHSIALHRGGFRRWVNGNSTFLHRGRPALRSSFLMEDREENEVRKFESLLGIRHPNARLF